MGVDAVPRLMLPLDLPGVVRDDPSTWVEVDLCDSKEHASPMPATTRLHWPTGPTDKCPQCAAALRSVAEVMGVHVHEEDLALGAMLRRLVGPLVIATPDDGDPTP